MNKEIVQEMRSRFGTPLHVYNVADMRQRAMELLALELPYGHVVRYAMKANPHPDILQLFASEGLHFDASSSYEAAQLLEHGIRGEFISLSSQQPAHNLQELLGAGVKYVATSRRQLELFLAAQDRPSSVGLRVNPGMGSGHNNRLTTGGPAASFGLWHEYISEALELVDAHGVTVDRLHVHVGTGGDPSKWGGILDAGLAIAERIPGVTSLDIGGGFKIAYTEDDTEADIQRIMEIFSTKLTAFAERTGRKLQLEIEPGRWLVAHAGSLITEVVDIVDTGAEGYTFLRTDTGMNDFLRPALYGAQHKMHVVNEAAEQADYVVVGHSCETSDILTPAPHDPERILTRKLNKAEVGDLVVIADTGAYCASMSAKGYNAYPAAKEILI